MKKNNDIEKVIKDKMNELSDSVDCFDRISARAFPEKSQDFYESGFTISDLENITGKAKRMSVIKWVSVAVAAAVCIAVIPQTNIIDRMLANIGSSKNSFTRIIEEIEYETEVNDYMVSDYTLDYYAENDVLITPLFACPFEKNNQDNTNVRIYTRQINGINTNQTYAVQYTGEYSESNIIAAAEPQYKFSDSDVEQAQKITPDDFDMKEYTVEIIPYKFDITDDGFFDSDKNNVSLASFSYDLIFKSENDIIPVKSEILYGQTENADTCIYDIKLTAVVDNSYKNMTIDNRAMWKKSVYFNGNPAISDTSESDFTRTEIFTDKLINMIDSRSMMTVMESYNYLAPFAEYKVNLGDTVFLYAEADGKRISTIVLPCNEYALPTTKLYFSLSSFNGTLELFSETNGFIRLYALKPETEVYLYDGMEEDEWKEMQAQRDAETRKELEELHKREEEALRPYTQYGRINYDK